MERKFRVKFASAKNAMHYTNKHNLPEPLLRAVTRDPYTRKSDFTVTELLKPARIVELQRTHEADMVEDASDRIWALMGQLGHLVLERAALNDYAEQRHFIERNGLSISGQVDLWKSEILFDYKFTSIYSTLSGLKPEWEQQCNLNCILCRENGVKVTQSHIVVIYRDWSVGQARRDHDYPQTQVQMIHVPIWPAEKQEAFLLERIDAMLEARKALPDCTPLERWARPEKWAIKKVGAVKATKLYDSEAEARENLAKGMYIEHRQAVQTRCLDYCPVAKWCDQFKRLSPAGWQAAQIINEI